MIIFLHFDRLFYYPIKMISLFFIESIGILTLQFTNLLILLLTKHSILINLDFIF